MPGCVGDGTVFGNDRVQNGQVDDAATVGRNNIFHVVRAINSWREVVGYGEGGGGLVGVSAVVGHGKGDGNGIPGSVAHPRNRGSVGCPGEIVIAVVGGQCAPVPRQPVDIQRMFVGIDGGTFHHFVRGLGRNNWGDIVEIDNVGAVEGLIGTNIKCPEMDLLDQVAARIHRGVIVMNQNTDRGIHIFVSPGRSSPG